MLSGWQLCCSCYETAKQIQDFTTTGDSNNNDDKMFDLQGELMKKAEGTLELPDEKRG